jgi:spoIIIJ-associated protein
MSIGKGRRQLTMSESQTEIEAVDEAGVTADGDTSADSADSVDSVEDADGAPKAERTTRSGSAVRDLEEEGEVAADYLEELLDIADLDGDIDIDVENGRASVAIVGESGAERSLRRLVGSNGDVLEALQELTRLAVQASTGDRSRLMLDIAGFREARRKAVSEAATRACQEVQRSGGPLRMEPMTAFERKIVHDVVAAAGLESESEGVDPDRRVVIRGAAAG